MSIKIEVGKYYRTHAGGNVGPLLKTEASQFVFTDGVRVWTEDGLEIGGRRDGRFDIIAEWTDTPAHIIQSSNGRTYDLTALETPFGLLPENVRVALKAWPHGLNGYTGTCFADVPIPAFHGNSTYRAKPAPQPKEWVLYWEDGAHGTEYRKFADTHRLIIRDDGNGNLTAEVKPIK